MELKFINIMLKYVKYIYIGTQVIHVHDITFFFTTRIRHVRAEKYNITIVVLYTPNTCAYIINIA